LVFFRLGFFFFFFFSETISYACGLLLAHRIMSMYVMELVSRWAFSLLDEGMKGAVDGSKKLLAVKAEELHGLKLLSRGDLSPADQPLMLPKLAVGTLDVSQCQQNRSLRAFVGGLCSSASRHVRLDITRATTVDQSVAPCLGVQLRNGLGHTDHSSLGDGICSTGPVLLVCAVGDSRGELFHELSDLLGLLRIQKTGFDGTRVFVSEVAGHAGDVDQPPAVLDMRQELERRLEGAIVIAVECFLYHVAVKPLHGNACVVDQEIYSLRMLFLQCRRKVVDALLAVDVQGQVFDIREPSVTA